MNAVIDIGNTKIKVGLFASQGIKSISILNLEEVIPFLSLNKVQNALVSNVALNCGFLKKLNKTIANVNELTIETSLPVFTSYTTPKTLGVDRLAACVAARNYTKGNVLVIDAGSCITYDLLTVENNHLGGLISPGIKMRLKAMHTLTSNLPLASFEKPQLIGTSTTKCLQSGATNGTLAEMKGLIKQFQDEFQNLSIIIGGGDAVFFDKTWN